MAMASCALPIARMTLRIATAKDATFVACSKPLSSIEPGWPRRLNDAAALSCLLLVSLRRYACEGRVMAAIAASAALRGVALVGIGLS